MDGGDTIGAVLGYDLLGLDGPFAWTLRKNAAAQLNCPEADVIMSCTHRHSGPHTRSNGRISADMDYIAKLCERQV